MPPADANSPENLGQARRILAAAGHATAGMSDAQLLAAAGEVMRQRIPAPAVPSGSGPVSARAWLSDALTSGGYAAPEDRTQRAELDDGGETVDLSVLAVLIMRHRPNGSKLPTGWDDAGLAERIHQPAQDISRAQAVLDAVADDVGVPARPKPRWWE